MVIDGDKFLGLIGLGKQSITAIDIVNRLSELGKEEVDRIMDICKVEINDRTLTFIPELKESNMYERLDGEYIGLSNYRSPVEIKKELKYCKNHMSRKQLQMELNMAYKINKRY